MQTDDWVKTGGLIGLSFVGSVGVSESGLKPHLGERERERKRE